MIEGFSPWGPLLGGILIGLSSALLWLGAGKIAGVSGILGRLLPPQADWIWRALFVVGLPVGAVLALWMGWANVPSMPTGNLPVIIAGGLLVGFGTRLGGGCTSGHGVCGLARLSPRSLVAVLIFMGLGAATVFLTRHVIGG